MYKSWPEQHEGMDEGEWTENSFSLGSSFLANHDGSLIVFLLRQHGSD
jgi:hypothetical protein